MVDLSNRTEVQTRFHELGRMRAAKLAVSVPLREQRDALTKSIEVAIADLNLQIANAESGLFEIDQERAALSRAIGGRTGEPQR